MSELAEVFDQLGQEIIPLIAESVFPDLMDVIRYPETKDALGGRTLGAEETVYSEIPVNYEPVRDREPEYAGEARRPRQPYDLEFPTHMDGERLAIDDRVHLLKVLERGNEPEKLFRIFSLRNTAGVVYKATCELAED